MKACHDFSPQQTECALSMLQIYESLGNLNQVIETLQVCLFKSLFNFFSYLFL